MMNPVHWNLKGGPKILIYVNQIQQELCQIELKENILNFRKLRFYLEKEDKKICKKIPI